MSVEVPTMLAADTEYVSREAEDFLRQCVAEVGTRLVPAVRLAEVARSIAATGGYTHSFPELSFGAKVAWRNTARCVGKFYWKGLSVVDRRDLERAEDIADAIVDHLRTATNGGRIRLLMSVFAPTEPDGRAGARIWNKQLVHYAGYRQPDGSVVGDPSSVEQTELALRLGWTGAAGTPYDVLPLMISAPGGAAPRLFDIPRDAVLEVPLRHPEYPWFADLGLRWYAFPSISDQRLEIGGISYPAAPFSAWYTGAEIGARNFSEPGRYNMLPVVAERMGLDTRTDRSLWKDRAMLEITTAVMHSFAEDGVFVIDHHFAAQQFVAHEHREAAKGRQTAGRWELMIPPMGGPVTPLWGRTYEPTEIRPNFYAQPSTP